MRLLLAVLALCSLFVAACGDDDYGKAGVADQSAAVDMAGVD
jgi:hypothetical protein